MNIKLKEIFVIILILILQTSIYIFCGTKKSYIHMDEAYSLGLASYDKTEIQKNKDFYNTWHNGNYYEDYLSVNDDETDYKPVYENQKNDVHPPLYYLILRFAMSFSPNHYSKWPGITINIIIYCFITIFTYLILKKLFKDQNHVKEKSIFLAFISGITMASLTNVLYIRMYSLATLNILITTYLHIKLFEKQTPKILLLIGIQAIFGVLTHYYYLFFLFMLYVIFMVKYIKEKEYKNLIFYTIFLAIAGVISLVIWPYTITHLFFGYRGKGALENLFNIPNLLKNIFLYFVVKLNYLGFNNLLFVVLGIIIGLTIYKNKKKIETKKTSEITKLILIPSIFYFLMISICSPYVELRYLAPISGLIFVLTFYYLYILLESIYKEKISNRVVIVLILGILISPLIFRIEPEVMFSDKKEICDKLENELNLPAVYFFNSHDNRFLDDILLFTKLDNSYIAKNLKITEENVKEIFENKDVPDGIIVFINNGQNNKKIINIVKKAMNLNTCQHLQRLNAQDVYYLK